jgi:hypothetical protein
MSSHPVDRFAQEMTDPTLGAVLRGVVVRTVPDRIFLLIQLAVPWAIQFARIGWWHSAAGMAAISAFGIWGMCEHRLMTNLDAGWRHVALRAIRMAGGVLAVGLTAALVLQQFLRLMGNPTPQG